MTKDIQRLHPITINNKMVRMFERNVFTASPCGCHYWIGHMCGGGYGNMKHNGVFYMAHRLSYEIYKGSTSGFLVCHHCDNRMCVNPEHLFLGTQKDNCDDRESKGRHLKGDKSPTSKLTSTQVVEILNLSKLGVRQYSIAPMFGISKGQVSKIVLRNRWAHIEVF